MSTTRPPFPFSAIVGQQDVCRALLATAVDPLIGGILIFGDRGTGKSTAVRALARLLPPMKAVEGCVYNCDPDSERMCDACRSRDKRKTVTISVPVVDLPLGATEDRVVGALDLESALTRGEKVLEPGLLARANRGFLYIDEVNLLEDHIVDLLLDVAASGENVIEREGLSVRHPARFVLIGSGNPEEGELRPQLLDRFGLSVDVSTPRDLKQRVEIVRRREAYERDPGGFSTQWHGKDVALRRKVVRARGLVREVDLSDEVLELASRLCMELGTDGLRGELTLTRTARAFAALDGARVVTAKHVRAAAVPALRHRLRRDPLDDTGSDVRIERVLADVFEG
ncbi:MAG: magnesium chelatase ATPase subunit I [Anderseniella sp.]|jgi:magnesium chelatase subunit I|nr:magnesium chelatase ATPase subunit I [Anderseniella sp.]